MTLLLVSLLVAINNSQRSELRGTLNLVDLAGSEHVGRSNAHGDRLNETKAINTSLSALRSVFVAIANKSSHVSGYTDRRPPSISSFRIRFLFDVAFYILQCSIRREGLFMGTFYLSFPLFLLAYIYIMCVCVVVASSFHLKILIVLYFT